MSQGGAVSSGNGVTEASGVGEAFIVSGMDVAEASGVDDTSGVVEAIGGTVVTAPVGELSMLCMATSSAFGDAVSLSGSPSDSDS